MPGTEVGEMKDILAEPDVMEDSRKKEKKHTSQYTPGGAMADRSSGN